MIAENRLDVVDGIGHFRLAGAWGFQQAVQAIDAAIAEARALGIKRLLVVTTGASGFEPPSMAERHGMIRAWAQTSEGMVTIAMVVPLAYIDPEKFGVVVAANFGVPSDVFTSEAEALAWLREEKGSTARLPLPPP